MSLMHTSPACSIATTESLPEHLLNALYDLDQCRTQLSTGIHDCQVSVEGNSAIKISKGALSIGMECPL